MATDRRDNENGGFADGLQPLLDDDAFLTSLSRGEDPSQGKDELAQLLLELRSEVNAQIPPAPVIDGAGDSSAVVPLASKRRNRRPKPWMAGFVGAAASAALIVGSGAAIYGAEPGSALWPVSAAVFGDRTAVVELAGTLEEMQSATESGDEDRARELLGQARSLMSSMTDDTDEPVASAGKTDREAVTVTETIERTGEAPRESGDPVTVTESTKSKQSTPTTVTETATQTETQTETQVTTVTVEVPSSPSPQPTSPQPTVTVTEMVPLQPATPRQ